MTSFVDPSYTSKSTYQNIQNNPSIKLTLYERISQLFFCLYEKISNLFSRKPNQMKKLKGIEPIYDVPKNNQLVKKPTLYERISNLFSREPSQEQLEEMNRQNTQLKQGLEKLHHYICVNATRINKLEACAHTLKDVIDAKEAENSLSKQTIPLEEELYSNRTQVSRLDSGFSEFLPMEKKHSLLSKARSYLETKIGQEIINCARIQIGKS
ncbi:hypothetical protein [Candidatus Rhabdochlamydia porcellionis]|jgi:hypothetical protein|uniref:Uncharacterized protein n=1 Tax=Candidatus Rhabdochlamydia porcellionis TaxID=225148 RepID=A0ABX8Z1K4_9BACT|nr:hypothetical protein [Candidatus Rhabdochlamydia porcellionis]QZA58188.1 hypothetical protein RHAB15C_0000058 [Candidatus Rhabdochlamydia porcellionis]